MSLLSRRCVRETTRRVYRIKNTQVYSVLVKKDGSKILLGSFAGRVDVIEVKILLGSEVFFS